MWPARGAPVVCGETVYFAAGIWPFMGVFVHAVDIGTGQPVWTNSGSGSNYIVQQHDSPAFAGIAPQGYLAVNDNYVLVSGGMTVPAVFERQTGRFVYYRPGDRELGRDQGGYEVLLGPDWFANHGRLHRLTDGEPLAQAPVDLITPQSVLGVSGKHLVVSQMQIVRYVETSVDKKGKETHTIKHKLPESFRVPLPEGITQIHLQAGDQLVASDGGSRVALLNIPKSEADACLCAVGDQSECGRLANACRRRPADHRRHDGTIRCYGAAEQSPATPVVVNDAPGPIAGRGVRIGCSRRAKWLSCSPTPTARQGYAVIDQPRDLAWLLALVQQTQFHIIALHDDPQAIAALREGLRVNGVLGLAWRSCRESADGASAALPGGIDCGRHSHESRPRQEPSISPVPWHHCARTAEWRCCRARRHSSRRTPRRCPRFEMGGRVGNRGIAVDRAAHRSPAGRGTWTSQNGDAGNTLVSAEAHVKAPLGVLWFGGPSNREVLPRHGHGPVPQVIGGRLFIEGRDMLRAVDVYTGRLLWQREFKDVGIFYDNTDHHPGAGAIGGNYVCTSDSVYLAWGRRCLRLDPATGDDARRILSCRPTTPVSSRTGAISACRGPSRGRQFADAAAGPRTGRETRRGRHRTNSNARCRCFLLSAKAATAWWSWIVGAARCNGRATRSTTSVTTPSRSAAAKCSASTG